MNADTFLKKTNRGISFFIRALKGEQQDYTTGSLSSAVILLAIPMILEMGMESVFAIVDLFFVSKLGKHAVSTVGLTESVLTIIYSLAIGMSMAATAIVARRIGEKKPKAAASAAMQVILVAIVIILILEVFGVVFSPDILRLMGAEPAAIKIGVPYIRTMMGSSIVITLLFLVNGIFRGAGDASIAMRSLGLANLCNIILCPLLINGFGPVPAMGLTGAALATTIGRSVGVVYQFIQLYNGKSLVKLKGVPLHVEWHLVKTISKLAWPATFQFIIGSCSWIFLAELVATTGHSAASAGYQTAMRIIIFFILPAWGISNAASTLVGQNLGAHESSRAELSVIITAKYNAIFMALVSILFFFASGPIVSIFTKQPDVKEYAITALRIISAGYIFYGVGMVLVNAFNGAGDTITPTIINIFCYWTFQVPLAYLLAEYFHLGPLGVFISVPVAETAVAVVSFFIFRRGKWKLIQV
ncbi:MAG: MATE family efflux transporter [Candidatus Dadabacteria bacterium]